MSYHRHVERRSVCPYIDGASDPSGGEAVWGCLTWPCLWAWLRKASLFMLGGENIASSLTMLAMSWAMSLYVSVLMTNWQGTGGGSESIRCSIYGQTTCVYDYEITLVLKFVLDMGTDFHIWVGYMCYRIYAEKHDSCMASKETKSSTWFYSVSRIDQIKS